MSGLAEILLQENFKVRGSDTQKSLLTEHLKECGAEIFYGQRGENIGEDTDLVVYTAAVHEDNPEYQEVLKRGIPALTRAELLGQMMKNYHHAVAIA